MDANKLTEAPEYEYDKGKEVGIKTGEVGPWSAHPGVHQAEDVVQANALARKLRARHMQMIAIGVCRSTEMELVVHTR